MDSSKAQIASERFAEGYNCAQAVMFAFSEDCGLSPDLALKAACGFGGGMGRKQEVCGAVTGAILVLSLRQGRGIQEGPAVPEEQNGEIADHAFLLIPRPDDRIFSNALLLDDRGLVNQLFPGFGRGAEAG